MVSVHLVMLGQLVTLGFAIGLAADFTDCLVGAGGCAAFVGLFALDLVTVAAFDPVLLGIVGIIAVPVVDDGTVIITDITGSIRRTVILVSRNFLLRAAGAFLPVLPGIVLPGGCKAVRNLGDHGFFLGDLTGGCGIGKVLAADITGPVFDVTGLGVVSVHLVMLGQLVTLGFAILLAADNAHSLVGAGSFAACMGTGNRHGTLGGLSSVLCGHSHHCGTLSHCNDSAVRIYGGDSFIAAAPEDILVGSVRRADSSSQLGAVAKLEGQSVLIQRNTRHGNGISLNSDTAVDHIKVNIGFHVCRGIHAIHIIGIIADFDGIEAGSGIFLDLESQRRHCTASGNIVQKCHDDLKGILYTGCQSSRLRAHHGHLAGSKAYQRQTGTRHIQTQRTDTGAVLHVYLNLNRLPRLGFRGSHFKCGCPGSHCSRQIARQQSDDHGQRQNHLQFLHSYTTST